MSDDEKKPADEVAAKPAEILGDDELDQATGGVRMQVRTISPRQPTVDGKIGIASETPPISVGYELGDLSETDWNVPNFQKKTR
ncbi:MAG: hypothetical protein AAF908_10390 [Pseudomonadota bacterium]